MKSELAERLLSALMDWDIARFAEEVPRLQALASLKYDEYGGYRAGVKFVENLARWLEQFDGPSERDTAYRFVMDRLVFVSDAELSHLVEVAYPDVMESQLLEKTAEELGEPAWRVRFLAESPEFASLRRGSLVVGLSDGARLDRLRRATPLSHEQFTQDADIDDDQATRLQTKLANALELQNLPGDALFRQVFLVDDFSGSGQTLLRANPEAEGGFQGKLWRFKGRLDGLREKNIVAADARVSIVLYVASEQAERHVRAACEEAGLGAWSLDIIQVLPHTIAVDRTDPAMAELCQSYFDPSTIDTHKREAPLGYRDCALPLVLTHNTPNNSVCLLWSETSEDEGLGRRALFPRYERHHKDRP